MTLKNPWKKTISTILATSVISSMALPVSSASAHEIYAPSHRHYVERHYHPRRDYRRQNRQELIAAGIIGLAVGAIIADSVARKHERKREEVFHRYDRVPAPFQPAPTQFNQVDDFNQNEPTVIRLEDEISLEPWTPGWHDWCVNRYRSFKPDSGTYRGYDGRDHFCVPK